MNNSTREFFRKWGSQVLHNNLMMPIISPKYDIGFVVKNCSIHSLRLLGTLGCGLKKMWKKAG